jgi:hypothetical protein
MGFVVVIGFMGLLQLINTSKEYSLTVLHTSQITTKHIRSSQSVTVSTSHCLVAAFNTICSSSSRFPNYPQPQLPASNSNSSQWLKCNYLTTSLTQQTNFSLHWLVVRSVKLLLIFASIVNPGFSLPESHDQDFYILLDKYMFRNGASNSMKEGLDFLLRRYACCTSLSSL